MRRSWKSPREGAEDVAAAICRPVPGLRELAVSPRLTPWAIVFRSCELWFRAFPESPLFCRTRLATVDAEPRRSPPTVSVNAYCGSPRRRRLVRLQIRQERRQQADGREERAHAIHEPDAGGVRQPAQHGRAAVLLHHTKAQ